MKKVKYCLALILAFILCFSLSGCKEWNWQFEQSSDNIEKIEIVDVKEIWWSSECMVFEMEPELYSVKKCIEKTEFNKVISDLESIIVEYYFGNPVTQFGEGFKVTYKNGDFDLITIWEPTHFYKKESYYIFTHNRTDIRNYKRFQELIEKWSA